MKLIFIRFIHFVNGKETIGGFCFPAMSEDIIFTEQQLLKILKLNGYHVMRIIRTDDHGMVH